MSGALEGGCICGAVRYRVRGKPQIALACHCRFCQRRLGTAFSSLAYFDEREVDILQGELRLYEHHSDESGRWLRMQFCARCGTTVTHTIEARPGLRAISLGTLDDPDGLKIDRHVWLQSKRPWVEVPEGVTEFPKGSAAPPKS